jgi:hypothetical protein
VNRANAWQPRDLGQSMAREAFTEGQCRVPSADHGQVGVQLLNEQIVAVEQCVAKTVFNEYQHNGQRDAEAEQHEAARVMG